jgi:hypothetical protein
MNTIDRRNGRLIRKIARLDMAWRKAGKVEGRVENRLAFELGNAARAGLGPKSRRVQCRNAAQLGQRSGWERN